MGSLSLQYIKGPNTCYIDTAECKFEACLNGVQHSTTYNGYLKN